MNATDALDDAVFIADVHLSPARPRRSATFRRFLESLAARPPGALFVLGDLFDYWIGFRQLAEFEKTGVIAAFNALSCPVWLLHGNRDFMISRRTAGALGARLGGERLSVRLAGRPALLLHGDQLLANDSRYMFYRRLVRSRLAKVLLHAMPYRFRHVLARGLRRQSSMSVRRKARHAAHTLGPSRKSLVDVFRAGFRIVVAGHLHRFVDETFVVDGVDRRLLVLPVWRDDVGACLRLNGGDFSLVSFP